MVTFGWAALVSTGTIATIWPMFGIANQLLSVLALALVTTLLVNTGRAKYAWVTILPMLFVTSTTMSAGATMVFVQFPAMIKQGKELTGYMSIAMTVFVVVSVATLLLMSASRWIGVMTGLIAPKSGFNR